MSSYESGKKPKFFGNNIDRRVNALTENIAEIETIKQDYYNTLKIIRDGISRNEIGLPTIKRLIDEVLT